MADKEIGSLTAATDPPPDAALVHIVEGGNSRQTTIGKILSKAGGGVIDLSSPMEAATTYNSSATWTKATDLPAGCNLMMVEIWGGGGGGGRGTSDAGGGGGTYARYFVDPTNCNTTETVTIGAGGAAQTVSNTDGNAGSDTSFGDLLGEGGGGGRNNNGNGGGNNVVLQHNINSSVNTDEGTTGSILHTNYEHLFFIEGGGRGEDDIAGTGRRYAGAGGGGANGGTAGGTSTYGGDGGAGNNAGAGTAGTQPGGGGGAGTTEGAAGGNGRVKVSYFEV